MGTISAVAFLYHNTENVDFIKKRKDVGAVAFEKQLGRLEKLDLDSDELFVIEGDAIPNDPGLPRVKIGPRFDK